MKHIAWLIVVLLTFSACAHTADSQFFSQISSQPVKLKDGTLLHEDETEPLISSEGMASQRLMNSVHDDLTSGYRVVDMDIHPSRIVLLLDTIDDSLIRIAQWNNEERTYIITNWPDLPDVYLDTYHDGNAVLFEWHDESFTNSVSDLMVTLEEIEGQWHVVRFTDALTYYVEKTDIGYLFCDYWEYETEEYQYFFTSPTQMGEVTWTHIVGMIDEYNALFPLRPALNDAYWDEEEK